ncbi:prolow-density lipoprotein receptor-related protein 1-like isoform X3 [Apostichopus japonicus]|uniref:prolow-density lipoprotein receptor-related protein 1-like isoform X3 n=1 Tax=Stichopus japonicus TaxID=307972 RepID=UPI003AB67D0F
MRPVVGHFYLLVLAFLKFEYNEVQATVLCLPSVQYACSDGFQCLPSIWHCDHMVECKDFSDEENCGDKVCGNKEFQCLSSKVCIPETWKCDGVQDCEDNSDEKLDCQDTKGEPYQCPANQWLCDTKTTPQCIHGSKICNGIDDCDVIGHLDESVACYYEGTFEDRKMCHQRNCTNCKNTLRGGFCWCEEGFQVNENTDKCEDIKECEEGACEQSCEESVGSYSCSCDQGYTKDVDGHCKAPDDRVLVYTNLTSIQSATISATATDVATLLPVEGVVTMDINVRNNTVCWITYGLRDHELNCSDMDDVNSTNINLHIDLKGVNDFAIDWVTGNFYFAYNLDQIIVCSNTGELCITILDTSITKPMGIALDPKNGLMFCTSAGQSLDGKIQQPSIQKAFMNGSHPQSILTGKLVAPRSIAVDPILKQLYWYDSSLEQIGKVDYDGSRSKILARGVFKVDRIAVFENFLYATRWGESSSLLRMDRFSFSNFTTIVQNLTRPGAIRIKHEMAQPQGSDDSRCKGKCEDLCLLTGPGETESVCRCQLGMTLVDTKCIWQEPTEPFLLYGQGVPGSVHGIPLTKEDNLNSESMKPITGLDSPRAVDFYGQDGYVYYSDSAKYQIGRQMLNGSGHEIILDEMIAKCEGLAVDWLGKNLYWTDDGLKIISVAKLDGRMRKVLVTENLIHPRDIEVDPVHGYMYWTDWAESKYSPRSGKVMQAKMNGEDVVELPVGDLLWPNGLSLDVTGQRLYWCDAFYDKIEMMYLRNRTTTVLLNQTTLFHSHPFGIAIHDGTIFWSEYRRQHIYKYENGVVSSLKHGGLMFEVKVYDTDEQIGTNACSVSNGGCDELCLALPDDTRECACGDGKKINGTTGQCIVDDSYVKFTRCADRQFSCKNGRCIDNQWTCDEENDCGDNSDEGCDAFQCNEEQFQCGTHKCISKDWQCDGDNDCGDNSDEESAICNTTCDGFRCDDDSCIAQNWVCDGDRDCPNGEEEEDCKVTDSTICEEGLFTCDTGSCIHAFWTCDGENDCGDNSDERNCGGCPSPDDFHCISNRTICIAPSRVCDGRNDCPDGSDESALLSCSKACEDGFFSCSEGTCIPMSSRCDGQEDCDNGMDENNCTCPVYMFRCESDNRCVSMERLCDSHPDCDDGSDEDDCKFKPCPRNTFACERSSLCVPYSALCNGTFECPHEDDEGGQCEEQQCSSLQNMESHVCELCQSSPNEPICYCPEGKILANGNTLTCVGDQNMCREDGRCSQRCVSTYDRDNDLGGFICKCYEGYAMQRDGCKYTGDDDPYIIFSNRNQLRRYNLKTGEYNILVFNLRNSIALDFHYSNSHIYWTDVADDKIYRGTVDTDSPNAGLRDITTVIQSGLGSSEGLAVDWIGQNLYWVESMLDQIEVATLNGLYRKTLIAGDIENPRAIVLDPRDGLMFWSDWEESRPRIERATMAGQGRTVIVDVLEVSGGWPNGLTLDYWERKVFWIDAKSDSIYSSYYNGSHVKWVLQGSPLVLHPFSITIFEDRVYWTDWRNIGVYSANKWTGENETEVQKVAMHPFGIHVYHKTKQPTAANPCLNSSCSHLCLINSSSSYVCACPHLMELGDDNEHCTNASSFLVFAKSSEIRGVDLRNSLYNVIPSLSSPQLANVTSVDHDVVTDHIFWTDTQRRMVGKVNIHTFKVEAVIEGLTNANQVAVDWVSRNIYWILHEEEGSFLYASQVDGSYQVKVNVELTKHSHSLVLDPLSGYMYWVNGRKEGSSPSIKRADMNGENTVDLITDGLSQPKRLALDHSTSMLYWCDRGDEDILPGIYSVPLDSSAVVKLLNLSRDAEPQSIAVHNGMLYWSDEHEDMIRSINIAEPLVVSDLRPVVGSVKGMFVYDKGSKIDDVNECSINNGGCSQLCFPIPTGDTSRACACTAGYSVLETDGTTCVGVEKFVMFSTLSSINGISTDSTVKDPQLPPVEGQVKVQSIAFHAKEDMIYWVDTEEQKIYRRKRDHTGKETVISSGLGYVVAIAVDPISGNLYWADQRTNTISVARIGKWEPYVVCRDTVGSVTSIAVDSIARYLFWTSNEANQSKVCRSYLDGSNQTTVLSDGLMEPKSLAVNDNKLYVCDGNRIICSDLDGSNQETIFDGGEGYEVSKIAVDEQFLYWIDNLFESGSILRINKNEQTDTVTDVDKLKNATTSEEEELTDIVIYSESLQNEGNNSCSEENGGCKQLCFSVGDIRRCACAYGKLDDDNISCNAYDDYIIFSERKTIERIPLGKDYLGSIPRLATAKNAIGIAAAFPVNGMFFTDIHDGSLQFINMTNATQLTVKKGIGSVEGIAFNHITFELFWTSYTNSSISRMRVFDLKPSVEEIVVKMTASDHPRGIALDICRGDIYWTNWNEVKPSIMKSSMAGHNPRAIITNDIRTPNGIVVDEVASKLYWCDARLDKIERADLDGSNRKIIVDSEPVHPFGLAVHEDFLFWTDWVTRAVIRVNKYTGGNFTVLRDSLQQQPMGIAVFTQPLQCENLPCGTQNGGCQDDCGTDEYGTIICNCTREGEILYEDGMRCVIEDAQSCGEDQFLCGNGDCIPYQDTCDGHPTCADGSDELPNYCEMRACRVGFFNCNSNQCYPDELRCNQQLDCVNGLDEENCGCLPSQFECQYGVCIEGILRCDHIKDCQNALDEMYCEPFDCAAWYPDGVEGEVPPFENCASTSVCIQSSWRCDNVDHCGDGSDEDGCSLVCPDKDYYRCRNSEFCIPESWLCDREVDCVHEDDEEGCETNCHQYESPCAEDPRQCILNHWKCDRDEDCPNGTDELNCGVDGPTCSPEQFRCPGGDKCIPLSWKCDNEDDCGDRSDEEDCVDARCNEDLEFTCDNGQCIRRAWVCDHDHDCIDGSDESDQCVYAPCDGTEFQCDDGRCILKDWQCDGQADCIDHSDEDNCSECAEQGLFHCGENQCISTQKLCDGNEDCDNGEDETDDKCADHSPCRDDLPCSQRCVDRPGDNSFYCYCSQGYTLVNGSVCSLQHEIKPYLVFSNRRNITVAPLDGKGSKSIIKGLGNAIAVDYDWQASTIYWSDILINGEETSTTIYATYFNSQDKNRVIHNSGIRNGDGLAVDWVGRNLYWTDKGLNVIEVSKLDGAHRKVLMDENLEEPRAIALNPRIGTFFWTDWGSSPYIGKAGMDGSNFTKLVTTRLLWPNGLTIDYPTDRVFWADAGTDRIEFVEYDGTNRHLIINEGVGTPHVFSISVFTDFIYWGDWRNHTIYKAHKYHNARRNSVVTALINNTNQRPMDLHVMHPLRQPNVTNNPCIDNGGCSHLCLLTEGGGSKVCACPTGSMTLQPDERTCVLNCPPLTFACATSKCISYWWVCDKQDDCGDNSDEVESICRDVDHHCEPGMFQCHSSTPDDPDCIAQVLVCDMEPDCRDESDESICSKDSSGACLPHQFQCVGDGRCISASFQCNGHTDCPDGTDEENCEGCGEQGCSTDSTVCGNDEFDCGGGVCIELLWRCDYENDCADHSDESDCPAITCEETWFACETTNECVPDSWKCDGEIDCSDQSDEQECPGNEDCEEDEFLCIEDNICIPDNWKCDGELECSNGTDESNCDEHDCQGLFKCVSTNRCLMTGWVCDGQWDCADGSDEENCDKAVCRDDDFQCDDTECVPEIFVCDGDRDCTDGTDEQDCGDYFCSIAHHMCDLGKGCIRRDFMLCDGVDQCGDSTKTHLLSSDERNCEAKKPAVDCSIDSFKCASGDCIAWTNVCDGREDCQSGNDETDCFRGIQCESDEGKDFCSDNCNNTRSGLRCSCPVGKQLNRDARSCDDIDECQEFGTCPFDCSNFNGGYHCSCPDGHYLAGRSNQPDLHTCKAVGSPPFLLVVDESSVLKVYQYSAFSRFLKFAAPRRIRPYSQVQTFSGMRLDSIDVNVARTSAYVLMSSNKTVGSFQLRGSTIPRFTRETGSGAPSQSAASGVLQQVNEMAKPKHIAVDWVTQRLYWTDAGRNAIGVLDLVSNKAVTLFEGRVEDPFAIRLHPRTGKLFFTTLRNASIYSASMDGSDLVRLPIGDLIWPTGLAIDYYGDRLYWADPKMRYIGSSDLRGGNVAVVKKFPRDLAPAFSIDVFESFLYGTTYLENGIFFMDKYNKDGPYRARFTILMKGLARPAGLVVFQDQKQQQEIGNPCSDSTCSANQFCLISSDVSQYSCQCVNGSEDCPLPPTDEPIDICDGYCQNGGTCQLFGRDPTCTCKDGFKGPQCAHKYCEEGLCQNGGKCELDICDCPPNFAGDHCQFKNEDVCKDYCQNGGTCRVNIVDSVLVPNCTCTETFYGATCSKECPCQSTQEGCTGDVCKSGGQADPNVDPNGGGAPVPILPIILVVAVFFIVILIIVFLVRRRRRGTSGFRHERINFEDDTEDIKFGNPSFGASYEDNEEEEDDIDLPFQNNRAKPAKIAKKSKKKKKKKQPKELKTFSEEERVEAIDEGDYNEKSAILS